jgi:hypothetical protein
VREHASGNLMRAGLTVLSVYYTNRYIFAGLTTDTATDAVAAWLEARGLGAKKVNYKLRDWLFARQVCWMTTILVCNARGRANGERSRSNSQRYWGEPFPIVFPDGSDQAVPLREGACDTTGTTFHFHLRTSLTPSLLSCRGPPRDSPAN